MRFYHIMSPLAPRKKALIAKLLPIIGGFALFSIVAALDQRLAMALAVGAIGFAAISMIIALTRKH